MYVALIFFFIQEGQLLWIDLNKMDKRKHVFDNVKMVLFKYQEVWSLTAEPSKLI